MVSTFATPDLESAIATAMCNARHVGSQVRRRAFEMLAILQHGLVHALSVLDRQTATPMAVAFRSASDHARHHRDSRAAAAVVCMSCGFAARCGAGRPARTRAWLAWGNTVPPHHRQPLIPTRVSIYRRPDAGSYCLALFLLIFFSYFAPDCILNCTCTGAANRSYDNQEPAELFGILDMLKVGYLPPLNTARM